VPDAPHAAGAVRPRRPHAGPAAAQLLRGAPGPLAELPDAHVHQGGGATNYGRFRFARVGIKLTFTAPGIASASISFTEAPDFAGEVQARPSTAYLFEFTYEVPSPVIYRYTSYEKPLAFDGHTFEPQKIEHGNRKQSTNPAKDELTVTCGEFIDSQGRRNPLWQRVGHGLERRCS
jgi:hypothetical protein